MSAWRVMEGRSRLREWQTVTVASASSPFLHEHVRNGLPHDVAPADNHDMTARDLHPGQVEQLLDAQGRAGPKPGWPVMIRPRLTG